MPAEEEQNLITSKDVLLKTGISRATLNNYIKMGILPRPTVKRPHDAMQGVKKIGYFPVTVLESIELVRQMKREGKSMDQVAKRFQESPDQEPCVDTEGSGKAIGKEWAQKNEGSSWLCGKKVRLTIENVSMPAYLLNYDFEIEWINSEAETRFFVQEIRASKHMPSRNIFKTLFSWEFHNHVKNWRDIIAFHMSFVKIKYARNWIENLFQGISGIEVGLLQEIYDRVEPFPKGTIEETSIDFSFGDGTVRTYRVYNIFSKEGIFFLYKNRGREPRPEGRA